MTSTPDPSKIHSNKTLYLELRKTLRHSLRKERRQLSTTEQQQHSDIICQTIIESSEYKEAQHIALYLSADGEVNLTPLLKQIQADSKHSYLPVILSREKGIMAFAAYKENTSLKKNSFGILEPEYQQAQLKTAQQLDIVLAPLVAFDEQGNRMGMGGGFYDRALQHLQLNPKAKPSLIGIAHELQKVTMLEKQNWDVRLNAIATEKALHFFH
jgi:5-formyltetrahydrofolate cyclo-ligase